MADSERELVEQALAPVQKEPEPPEPDDEGEDIEDGADEAKGEAPKAEAETVPQQRRPRNERVPLPEYLTEREKRQTAERERDAIAAERKAAQDRITAMERQLAELSRKREAEQPMPDILTDPDAYRQSFEQRIEQRVLGRIIDASFARAKRADPATFDQAWQAMQHQVAMGDIRLRDTIVNDPDPGEAMLSWHRERQALQEIGPDINAWRQKQREALLADPEFRKVAMDKWRAEANQAGARPGQRPNVTDLPSLNSATGGSSDPAGELSERELVMDALRPRTRQRG